VEHGVLVAAGNDDAFERMIASVPQGAGAVEVTPVDAPGRVAVLGSDSAVTGVAHADGITLVAYGSGLRRLRTSRAAAAQVLLDRYRRNSSAFLDGTHADVLAVVVDNPRNQVLIGCGEGVHRWYRCTAEAGLVAATHPALVMGGSSDGAAIDRSYEDFLLAYAFLPDGHTVFDEVRALPAGHVFYWPAEEAIELGQVPEEALPSELDDDEAADILLEVLQDTVAAQAGEERAHAVLLGGFDSALVAALLARLGLEVHTYTFAFAEDRYNQRHVDEVVDRVASQHTQVPIDPDLIARGLRGFAEVFALPVAQPHYLLHTLAANDLMRAHGLGHAFSGDGCDAAFFGYPTVRRRGSITRWVSALPPRASQATRSLLATSTADRALGRVAPRARGVLEHSLLADPERSHLPIPVLDDVARRRLRDDAPEQAEAVETVRRRLAHGASVGDPAASALHGYGLTGQSRFKVDGAVASTGVAQSSPYLDVRVRHLARALEARRASGQQGSHHPRSKGLLMHMAERSGLLPPSVIHQGKQSPASSPIDEWYRGALRPVVEELFDELPFRVADGSLDHLLRDKRADRVYRRYVAGLSTHILQPVGLLCSYGSFGGFVRRSRLGRS
jgi:asparagine synthetase B (glutamine-hydrolysing)